MVSAIIFDLDMTLVDSSPLENWRIAQVWSHVRTNIGQVKPFLAGTPAPHELPGLMKQRGARVAVVTSSPGWYAQELIEQFKIEAEVVVSYEDTENHKPDPEPIQKALDLLNCNPDEALHVGDAPIDTESSFHAAVVSVGAGWGVKSFEALSSAAPDILLRDPGSLLLIENAQSWGYAAEVMASQQVLKLHRGSVLPCGGTPPRYALGRYFPTEDPRHATSPLSNLILVLKNEDGPAEIFGQALASALARVRRQVNCVVPVPPKPSQNRNRFEAVFRFAEPLLPADVQLVPDGLRCVKEIEGYKSLGSADRAEAIEGAFESTRDWDSSRVLLVDDVLTTGSTIEACAQELMARGAASVEVLVLGKDQQTFSRKECPACGRAMRVRVNSHTQEKFWGCSGYPNQCRHTEDIDRDK